MTTARTIVEVSYNFKNDRSIATTKEPFNSRADSELAYAAGTGANKVSEIHSSRRILTSASGTDDIDLQLLTDPSGVVINFQIIRWVYIKNREVSGGATMRIGGAGTNAWIAPWKDSPTPTTVQATIEAGGEWFISSPIDGMRVITAERLLRIEHVGDSSGNLDYDFVMAGE